jgi:tetratricopeptide (TPR) repeat protein
MPSDATPSSPASPADLLQQGRYQDAIAAFDEHLNRSPGDVKILRQKAGALLALGNNEGALASYDAILRIKGQDVEARIEKADLLVWLARHKEAVTLYDEAINLGCNNTDVYQKKGLALRLQGLLDKALVCYDTALEKNSNDPRAWWGKGDVLLDQQQFSAAFEYYAKGDVVDSTKLYGASAWTDRGDKLFDIGNRKDALFCYEKSTQLDPAYLWAWRGKGLALGIEKPEEAIECFDRALKQDSKDESKKAVVWAEKGNLLLDLGRYAEASACYQRALEIEPENLVALINQGIVRQEEGNYEEAIDYYDRVLAIDDQRLEVWQSKGVCLGYIGKNEESIQCYDRVLQAAEDSIWAWNNKGYALTLLGKHEEALLCFDKAIPIDKSEVLPWTNKAIALRNLNRYSEVEECLRLAAEIVNDKYSALRELGSFLGNYKWDPEGAVKVYQRLLNIRSEADIQASMAECLIKLGRYEEGRQAVLRAQPNEEFLRCIISYLIVVSYGLEGDGANFESSFKRFLSHFEQRNDAHGLRVGAGDWDYRSLVNTIDQNSPDLRTRFLLSLSVDLQTGNIDRSKLAFFKTVPPP